MFAVPEWDNIPFSVKNNFDKKLKKKKHKESPMKINITETTKKSQELRKIVNVKAKFNSNNKNKFNQNHNYKIKKTNSNSFIKGNSKFYSGQINNKHNEINNTKNVNNKLPNVKDEHNIKSKWKNKKKGQKRKLEANSDPIEKSQPKKKKIKKTAKNLQNFDSDKPDECLLNERREIIMDTLKNDDNEHLLFNEEKLKKKGVQNLAKTEDNSATKFQSKKDRIKKVLDTCSMRNPIKTNSLSLRERMLEKLKAAQFRFLNEKLYTTSGSEARELFRNDPTAFRTYHEGYQQQLKKWPINPLDVIIKKISKMPKTIQIADMGCGEAKLSKSVPQLVRSFDLVAAVPGVEACDITRTPLLASSMDVTVYCLALMGTDLTAYLIEANRVLKLGGTLLIAEVESRFDNVDAFTKDVQRLGFKLTKLDKTNQVFFFIEFKKVNDPPKLSKAPRLTLKPCLYKRR